MSDRLELLTLSQTSANRVRVRPLTGPGSRLALQRYRPSIQPANRNARHRVVSNTPFTRVSHNGVFPKHSDWRRVVSNDHDPIGEDGSTTMAILQDLQEEHPYDQARGSVDFPNPYSSPSSPAATQWDVHPPVSPSEFVVGKGRLSWDRIVAKEKGSGLFSLLPKSTESSDSSIYSSDARSFSSLFHPAYARHALQSNPVEEEARKMTLKTRTKQSVLDSDSRYPTLQTGALQTDAQHSTRPLFIDKQPIAMPSMNPNRNVTGQAYTINGERSWSTGLCSLGVETPGSSRLAVVCPSIAYGQGRMRLEHLRTFNVPLERSELPIFSHSCLTHAALSLFCIAWPLHVSTRSSIRKRYDIEGTTLRDLSTAVFCPGCGMAQESREIGFEEQAMRDEMEFRNRY